MRPNSSVKVVAFEAGGKDMTVTAREARTAEETE
jgi:hypothetical protein